MSSPLVRSARIALAAGLLAVLAACGAGDDDMPISDDESALTPLDPGPDDDVSRTPWENVSLGVSYKHFDGGANVLLVYGGYSAQDEYVQRWTDELYRVKGATLGLGHLYAVRGPNDPGYANREIGNRKLSQHLGAENRAANASRMVLIAHSSGTYVADELLKMLDEASGGVPPNVVSKIDVFNLDGGGPGSPSLFRRLASAHFVLACDPDIHRCSHNSSGMRALGEEYASLGGAYQVDASNSRCDPTAAGGLWCMHDTMITTWPHNPTSYDLKRDYTDFANGRRLVTSYLDTLH
jgi:hypothetical protein